MSNLRGAIHCEGFALPLKYLMILGIKREKTNKATEKMTLKEISWPHWPEDQICLMVPMKKVKMKVPTMIPNPVPKK